MISYEVIFGLLILMVIFLAGSFNLTTIIESQQAIWYIVPLLPISLLFLIAIIAETNRAPMDLPEAESELVAGFFTEHSSVPYVMFFLAEYGSIILMSSLFSILFLGGYHVPTFGLLSFDTIVWLQPIALGFKTSIILFIFIWVVSSPQNFKEFFFYIPLYTKNLN
jgi:NADH-ubiquinone oxidoreductase chain 1